MFEENYNARKIYDPTHHVESLARLGNRVNLAETRLQGGQGANITANVQGLKIGLFFNIQTD